jgi:hypothetical protein
MDEECGGNEVGILFRELDTKMECHQSKMVEEFEKIKYLQL